MARFRTGFLSVFGALVASLIHGLCIAIVDFALSCLLPLLPLSGEISRMITLLLTTLIIYSAGAWITHFFVCIWCIHNPSVNEVGIRIWLLFRLCLSLIGYFARELSWFESAFCVLLAYAPSHMFIWRRRANLDLNKPVAEPTQEEDVPADSISSPDHLPSTLTRSVKVTKE